MSAVRNLQLLADLAEVQCPDEDSCGAEFLLGIAQDAADRLAAISGHVHTDEVRSIAETALAVPYTDDPSLWQALVDLRAFAEDVAAHVPPHANMSWRVEAALTAVAHRLASALVAEALAAWWDYAV